MIYLASTSPRRKKILRELGIPFRILKSSYREANASFSSPSECVRRHALGKGRSAAKRIQNGTVLAADTIVYFENRIIGKPKDRKHAQKILSRLQGRWHTVYTGVACVKVMAGKIKREKFFCEKTRVRLRKMDKTAILAYFRKVNPLDKAGAYAIQSQHAGIVEGIRGSFSNAVGLPVESLKKCLKNF